MNTVFASFSSGPGCHVFYALTGDGNFILCVQNVLSWLALPVQCCEIIRQVSIEFCVGQKDVPVLRFRLLCIQIGIHTTHTYALQQRCVANLHF